MKKEYNVNRSLLTNAVKELIKILVQSVKVEDDSWAGRLKVVVEIKEGKLVDKFAKLVVSTDQVFETDTTIIDAADLASSAVFEAMIKKVEV